MKDSIDEYLKGIIKKCIAQKKLFEFVIWSLKEFPEIGWQKKIKKLVKEELKHQGGL